MTETIGFVILVGVILATCIMAVREFIRGIRDAEERIDEKIRKLQDENKRYKRWTK